VKNEDELEIRKAQLEQAQKRGKISRRELSAWIYVYVALLFVRIYQFYDGHSCPRS